MKEDIKALKFVSNVIELKPNKKYLLVFKGNITVHQLNGVIDHLRAQDIHSVGIAIHDDQDLQVIEAPDDPWNKLGHILTINECRALFEAWEIKE
jgi:hypothetical protein